MIVKPENHPVWTEKDKMGYVISRTGNYVQTLEQTGYLKGKYIME